MRWLIAITLLASPAALAEEDAHLIAFTEGRYVEAVDLAQASPSPDRLAFAARSLLADAISANDYEPPLALLENAEQMAREALVMDPGHVEARLQLAIALSLKARPLSNREAMRAGFGKEAKDLADGVLLDDPDNTYAHGFLAVWHLEVRRRGGSIGASVLGASVKKARHHYHRAVELSPGDASVHWQYGRALTALHARKYRTEAEASLSAALSCESDSTLERVMRDRAQILQTALQSQKRSAVEKLAARML